MVNILGIQRAHTFDMFKCSSIIWFSVAKPTLRMFTALHNVILYLPLSSALHHWRFVGRLFVKRFALCYRSVVCLSVLSVCDVVVLWPSGWMHQGETWHGGRPWPRPHCVRWGSSSPSPKGQSPQFSAHVCCGQTAGWIKMPLGTEVGLGPGHIVLDGDRAPPPQKGCHLVRR